MRKMVKGVYSFSKLSEEHGYDFNGHFIEDAEGNIIIDPVEPSSEDLAFMVERGAAHIVITNRNHSRASNLLRSKTGAQTYIHRSDAQHAQKQGCHIDEAFSEGESFGPLLAVSAAGKSPGEVALYWQERGILIVGDAMIGDPPGKLRFLPEAKLDDPMLLRKSIRTLAELEFDTLLVGDGVSIVGGAKEAVRALVDGF